MKYSATVYFATGFGVGTKKFVRDSFVNIKHCMECVKTQASDNNISLEKIVFSFPSGKQFVEKLCR